MFLVGMESVGRVLVAEIIAIENRDRLWSSVRKCSQLSVARELRFGCNMCYDAVLQKSVETPSSIVCTWYTTGAPKTHNKSIGVPTAIIGVRCSKVVINRIVYVSKSLPNGMA